MQTHESSHYNTDTMEITHSLCSVECDIVMKGTFLKWILKIKVIANVIDFIQRFNKQEDNIK